MKQLSRWVERLIQDYRAYMWLRSRRHRSKVIRRNNLRSKALND